MHSQTAEYALRAVLHLAAQSGGVAVRVPELAEATGVPRNHLSKTLRQPCGSEPCAVHARWGPIAHGRNAFSGARTVADLTGGVEGAPGPLPYLHASFHDGGLSS